MADLIDVTWDITMWRTLISTGTFNVILQNYTVGNNLTVILYILTTGFSLSSFSIKNTVYITLNPLLKTNLTAVVGSGNLRLNTTNSQVGTFVDLLLTTGSGNCDSIIANGSVVYGDIDITTGSGNNFLSVVSNSDLFGTLTVTTGSGNNDVEIGDNCLINDNFVIDVGSGNCEFTLVNCSLNNSEITGTIGTGSGNLWASVLQNVDPNGNLTLSIGTGSGNARL
ncbi:MAG: hypothetical protein ACXACR_17780, partial [Candidatus Hodarchaeales archaeon]